MSLSTQRKRKRKQHLALVHPTPRPPVVRGGQGRNGGEVAFSATLAAGAVAVGAAVILYCLIV